MRPPRPLQATHGPGRSWCEARIVEPGVIAIQRLLGAIARAHQRTRDAFEKTECEGAFAIAIELRRRDETLDAQVIERRPQVLPQGEEVDRAGPQIEERCIDFGLRLA